MELSTNMTISDIKESYLAKVDGDSNKCRFFVKGRELMDHHKLGQY